MFLSKLGTEGKCRSLANDKFRKALAHEDIIDSYEMVIFLHWNFSVHMRKYQSKNVSI